MPNGPISTDPVICFRKVSAKISSFTNLFHMAANHERYFEKSNFDVKKELDPRV